MNCAKCGDKISDHYIPATEQNLYNVSPLIILRDYDGYDHTVAGMSLSQVLNFPRKKMGHAFILAMLLTNIPALQDLAL